MKRISIDQGQPVTDSDKPDWLHKILERMLEEAKRRIGEIDYKVTVAFWSRPVEAVFLPAYFRNGFNPQQPEDVKMESAVDFKVADEVRRAQQQAIREGDRLRKVIIVSGDGDYATVVRTLVNEGVNVQIWSGSRELNRRYAEIVGDDHVVIIDDVCRF